MTVRRVDPDEAATMLGSGWSYLDVRSIPEFEQGHPKSAYNVPLLHFEPGRGLTPNAEFLAICRQAFAPDTQLVVGCKSGGRSLRAAQMLADAGFTNVVDMRGGFSGEPAAGGGPGCAGWASRGLPVSSAAEPGRSYEELKRTAS